MSLFVIIAYDAPNSQVKRAQYLKPHCEALASLQEQGRLFAAGPLSNSTETESEFIGSLLIIDFNSQAEAENWFNEEPYCKVDVYKNITIKPYIDAIGVTAHASINKKAKIFQKKLDRFFEGEFEFCQMCSKQGL